MGTITSQSEEDVRKLFSDLAIYSDEDATVGKRVEAMQKRGMALESSDGLTLCRVYF